MNAKGKFITLEGIDGSGKTTCINKLHCYLSDKGIPHITTECAKGTPFSKDIVNLLIEHEESQSVSSSVAALIFMAAAKQTYDKVIKPAIDNGLWVICDRFVDSTLVYHGFAENNPEFIECFSLLKEFTFKNIAPDLTFILDCPVLITEDRLKKRDNLNVYDKKDFNYKNNMRQGYLQIATHEKQRCVIINANQEQNAVVQDISNCIIKRFYDIPHNNFIHSGDCKCHL